MDYRRDEHDGVWEPFMACVDARGVSARPDEAPHVHVPVIARSAEHAVTVVAALMTRANVAGEVFPLGTEICIVHMGELEANDVH